MYLWISCSEERFTHMYEIRGKNFQCLLVAFSLFVFSQMGVDFGKSLPFLFSISPFKLHFIVDRRTEGEELYYIGYIFSLIFLVDI